MSKSTLTPSQPSRDRREFLRLAGLLVGGAAAVVMPDRALAAPADEKASPKPENVLGPEAALHRLMAGNRRYVEGVARRHDFVHEREALTRGQNPYAGLLSCADSRIAPEYAFDSGRGDLFVVRVAGNFVTADGLASLEYGVAVLQTPLLMVLGHGSCGAVDAGIKSVKNGTRFPGQIQRLADALAPSVRKALDQQGDTLENAIRQNVLDNVARLRQDSPILGDAVAAGKLKIVGGVYRLSSGQVDLLD